MENNIKKILVTEDQIKSRCIELAQEITNDYKNSTVTPLFVGLLKGSVPFMAELIKHIKLNVKYDFMCVSSYGNSTESLNDVKIIMDLNASIKNVPIILVEDIVDTGNTVKAVKELLYNKGASDVKVVSLLDKPSRRKVNVKADYVGFEVPNEFVVGFGLDFAEEYRQLPFVGVLKEECYEVKE